MMFSATFPKEIQDLAQDFLDPNYLWIGVGRVGSASVMVDQRFADVSTVEDDDKFSVLLESIQRVRTPEGNLGKTLIFANSKTIVDDLTWKLADCRIRASQIHGGLTQAPPRHVCRFYYQVNNLRFRTSKRNVAQTDLRTSLRGPAVASRRHVWRGVASSDRGRGVSADWQVPVPVRPISLLGLSLLRFVDLNFPGIPYGHENSTP